MTVRQLLLVVILIAASFLGGAFVNGPGLQWVQARLLRSLGLSNGGEIASIELQPTITHESGETTPNDGSKLVDTLVDRTQGPIAPIPSFQTETESRKEDVSEQATASTPKATSITNRSGSLAVQRPSSSHQGSASALNNQLPLRSDHKVTPVGSGASKVPLSTPSPSFGDTAPAILDSLAALLPADSPASAPSSQPLSSLKPDTKVRVSGTDSWAILERKMKNLGVVRYTIDGAPDGAVLFSCLIPLAGRQAVTQRFEGEGDDIIHATQAALRRIALWRASQPTPR